MSDKDTAGSASKTDEQKSQQQAARTDAQAAAKAGPVVLEHGDPDPRVEAEREANEKVAKDPYGDTPLQMRDTHSPEVDPEKVGVSSGGTSRPVKIDAMEPGTEGAEDAPKGGTNAPA